MVLLPLSPNKPYGNTSLAPGNRAAINAEKAQLYPYAKEIEQPSGFINTDSITIGSLIGKKVILVDFWTYSCINCQRTLPYLNMWYSKYHDQGLEIIGVHKPEFQFEHDIGNVRQAVRKFDIRYPVVLDNLGATWSSYGARYWPEDYLIDIDGFVVERHIGEGDYDTTEQKIQGLLRERAQALGINASIPNATGVPSDMIPVNFSEVMSPETYFGALRNNNLANGVQLVVGVQNLTRPPVIHTNNLSLVGSWNIHLQYAENTGNASIIFRYHARNVYFVASATNATTVTVMLDGKPLTSGAGSDSINSTVSIRDERLYTLVSGNESAEHTLELNIPEPGLRAYTLTFG
jgi:thiol-disulfide isomerase/thioredoxin